MENKEKILGWDINLEVWHIMVDLIRDGTLDTLLIVSSCQSYLKPGKRHVDYYLDNNVHKPCYTFPSGINLENISTIFKYDNICKSCIKKEVPNIKEFKQWLIVQKLKYL